MKILYHHRTLNDGAEGIHIQEMCAAFQKLGHKMILTGPAVNKSSRGKFSLLKRLVRGPLYELMEMGYNIAGIINLARLIKRHRPDMIYDRYMIYNVSSVLAGQMFKIPTFTEVNAPLAYERSFERDEKLYFKTIAFLMEKWIVAKSYKAVVVSTPLKRYFLEKDIPDRQLIVLPNGVNIEKFKSTDNRKKILTAHSISVSSKIIGFTGILRPWHGIDLLLKAFKNVREEVEEITLMMVGDGPDMDPIYRQIETLDLKDSVVATGRVPHDRVPAYINVFDIAVSPKTTFYASPMKIPEYMALKKCIVAPDTENIRDLLQHGETGVLFEPESPLSLSKALIHLLEDAELREKIGSQAHEAVKFKAWENNANKIIDVYNGYADEK